MHGTRLHVYHVLVYSLSVTLWLPRFFAVTLADTLFVVSFSSCHVSSQLHPLILSSLFLFHRSLRYRGHSERDTWDTDLTDKGIALACSPISLSVLCGCHVSSLFHLMSLSSLFLSSFAQVPQALGVRHVGRRPHVPGDRCSITSFGGPHSLNPALGESPIVSPTLSGSDRARWRGSSSRPYALPI